MKHILFLLTLLVSFPAAAQSDRILTKKIDSLFTRWNIPNHPGGAIGVVKDGKTIYSKAFGLASLEYLVPNSPGTFFNTGSVSKQFTAMGIVRLEEEGKLSFDDEVQKYIPELPDFEHPITIRHLLHHTSGLRSLHALFALAGWRNDDSRTNEDLNRIILKQENLNFKPGSEYLYCNTGYMLMANIIEAITGEVFREWMKKHIFDALDMKDTYVEDQYNRVVPNNATSYYGGTSFERAVEYWGYVGSGNMHSTTADLLKWLANFASPQSGWESSFRTMQTVDPFNDGTPNNYAFGVVLDRHLGKDRVQHGGSIGGFRAYVATYPGENLNIAVLTNFSSGNPRGNADRIAEYILGKSGSGEARGGAPASTDLSTETLNRFEGAYWNGREKIFRKVYLKADTLRYSRSPANESTLIPVSRDSFIMADNQDVSVRFIVGDRQRQMVVASGDATPLIFGSVSQSELSGEEQTEYAGRYYSTEVETTYTLAFEEGQLVMYHIRHGRIPLKPLFTDVFSADWPLGIVEIKRDPSGGIEGILISNGRVRNAWFERL